MLPEFVHHWIIYFPHETLKVRLHRIEWEFLQHCLVVSHLSALLEQELVELAEMDRESVLLLVQDIDLVNQVSWWSFLYAEVNHFFIENFLLVVSKALHQLLDCCYFEMEEPVEFRLRFGRWDHYLRLRVVWKNSFVDYFEHIILEMVPFLSDILLESWALDGGSRGRP